MNSAQIVYCLLVACIFAMFVWVRCVLEPAMTSRNTRERIEEDTQTQMRELERHHELMMQVLLDNEAQLRAEHARREYEVADRRRALEVALDTDMNPSPQIIDYTPTDADSFVEVAFRAAELSCTHAQPVRLHYRNRVYLVPANSTYPEVLMMSGEHVSNRLVPAQIDARPPIVYEAPVRMPLGIVCRTAGQMSCDHALPIRVTWRGCEFTIPANTLPNDVMNLHYPPLIPRDNTELGHEGETPRLVSPDIALTIAGYPEALDTLRGLEERARELEARAEELDGEFSLSTPPSTSQMVEFEPRGGDTIDSVCEQVALRCAQGAWVRFTFNEVEVVAGPHSSNGTVMSSYLTATRTRQGEEIRASNAQPSVLIQDADGNVRVSPDALVPRRVRAGITRPRAITNVQMSLKDDNGNYVFGGASDAMRGTANGRPLVAASSDDARRRRDRDLALLGEQLMTACRRYKQTEDISALLQWGVAFSNFEDVTNVIMHSIQSILTNEAGLVAHANEGNEKSWYCTRERLGVYAFGQLLAYGTGIHNWDAIFRRFCLEALQLPLSPAPPLSSVRKREDDTRPTRAFKF